MPKLNKVERLAALVLDALATEDATLDDRLKALGHARTVLCAPAAQSIDMREWRKQRAAHGLVGSQKKNETEPTPWDSKKKADRK